MRRRWTADQIARLLKEADKDLARKLTVTDICRKHGISQSMYYRWRGQHDPKRVDADRQLRDMEIENDRLKKLVAELLLDNQILQDISKKKW
jgi:putative transposase